MLLDNQKFLSFTCQLATTKNFQFYETASACHITPLGHLERPREGCEKYDGTSFWHIYQLYCPSTTSGASSGYRSWVHAISPSIFIHRRRHQTNMGFFLIISSVLQSFKKTLIKKWKFYSHNLSKWKILKNHRMCIAGVKQFCQSYYSWLTLSFHMLGKFHMFLILKSFSR